MTKPNCQLQLSVNQVGFVEFMSLHFCWFITITWLVRTTDKQLTFTPFLLPSKPSRSQWD